MRTTVNIDDDLLLKASELTGTQEKAALLREALKALTTLDDQDAIFALELADGVGKRRLRDIARPRRPSEMPLLRQGEEIFVFAEHGGAPGFA